MTPFDYITIGRTLFAIGRFVAALMLWFLKPRWMLLISFIGAIIFSVLCMNTTGNTAIAMGIMIFLLESSIFSTTFAISLRSMARHTKSAGAILAMAISSAMCFPFAQYAAAQNRSSVSYSYCVLVALFSAGAIFPLYLNLVPTAQRHVDPIPNEHLRRLPRHLRVSSRRGGKQEQQQQQQHKEQQRRRQEHTENGNGVNHFHFHFHPHSGGHGDDDGKEKNGDEHSIGAALVRRRSLVPPPPSSRSPSSSLSSAFS